MPLKNILSSTHQFLPSESHLAFKFRVLNYFMLVAVVFGLLVSILGSLDIMKTGMQQSVVIFVYSLINLALVWYLRQHKSHFISVAWVAVLVSFLLYIVAFINVNIDEARIVWFYILVYIAYMLLSIRAGIVFTLLTIVIVVVGNSTMDLKISETAIATFLIALIILSLLARAHAMHLAEYEKKLTEQNLKLEANIDEMDYALEVAHAANKVKSLFLANMSHEIRTPMNGVLSMAQVLENTELDELQHHYLASIQRSGDMLLVLIDDLLDLSKIESGTFSLNPDNAKTWQTIEDILNQAEPLFDQVTANFSVDIQEGLPAAVYVDAIRLKQVVVNLIANAAKFTPEGEVVLRIHGEYVDDGYHFIIEIEDNGIGIPQEKQKSIFGVFQQLSADRIANKGVGLGLSICHEIVEKMHGSISLKSEIDVGSCFRVDVTLPVVEIPTDENTENQLLFDKKLRVLVFEDDNISRLAVTTFLKGDGHEIVAVDNGQKGIDILLQETFDVILMDIHMPVLNGLEATRLIKSQGLSDAPVIGMTASVMNDEKESYLNVGMDALVEKPIRFKSLMAVVIKQLT